MPRKKRRPGRPRGTRKSAITDQREWNRELERRGLPQELVPIPSKFDLVPPDEDGGEPEAQDPDDHLYVDGHAHEKKHGATPPAPDMLASKVEQPAADPVHLHTVTYANARVHFFDAGRRMKSRGSTVRREGEPLDHATEMLLGGPAELVDADQDLYDDTRQRFPEWLRKNCPTMRDATAERTVEIALSYTSRLLRSLVYRGRYLTTPRYEVALAQAPKPKPNPVKETAVAEKVMVREVREIRNLLDRFWKSSSNKSDTTD